jgi:MFS transporter, DHA2 family, glioxin efflux transporter
LAGGLLSTIGRFAPFLIIGGIISTIGAGLIYMLDIGSSSSQWIGYQILAGIGLGSCFQTPIMAGQALAKSEDVSSVNAIMLCTYFPSYSNLEDDG